MGLFWVNPPILNLHIQNRLLSSGPPVSLRTCSALFDKVTPPYYFPHDVSLHWLWSQIWSLNYDSANQLMQNAYRYLILDASSLSVLKFPGGGGDMIGSVPLQCYRFFFFIIFHKSTFYLLSNRTSLKWQGRGACHRGLWWLSSCMYELIFLTIRSTLPIMCL